jgi:transcriptional regulator GlxA family with amidase domain
VRPAAAAPGGRRLAGNLLDLLATLFSERAGVRTAGQAALRRSLLLSVHSWIDAHLADPELDPDTIARANHISVRSLHKLFHDQGTSVARWVREQRLANCRRDLADPALAERGVHAIARRWGFDDAAHFSKIFKASYGEPPGAYRAKCAGGQ